MHALLVLSALTVALLVGLAAAEIRTRRDAARLEREAAEARKGITVRDAAQLDRIAGARLVAFRVTDSDATFGFGFPTQDDEGFWYVRNSAEVTVPRDPERPLNFWSEIP